MRLFSKVIFSAAALATCLPVFAQPVIVTAAGTDLVFPDNGKPAAGVALGFVTRVTVDPSGRPVFADKNFHLIFRVNADGSIQVIAGNNVQGLGNATIGFGASGGGYSGDAGPATQAALNRPGGVAYDSAGNLYIADTYNHRIRVVNPQGVINTFAGNGTGGFNGDGLATSVSLYNPTDVAVDASGNVYVNDTGNARIRKITPQGNLSTVCGIGTAGSSSDGLQCTAAPINDVEGMAFDAQGNLYFSEAGANRVRKVTSGTVATVISAGLNYPSGLAFDSAGNLLITDTHNQRIRKLAGASPTGALTVFAGSGQSGFTPGCQAAATAGLHNPFGLAASPAGTVYIADRDNFRIRSVDTTSTLCTVAGNGALLISDNGAAPQLARFFDPYGVSFNSQGAILVADTDNNIVRRSNPDGTLATIIGTGAQDSGGTGPAAQVAIAGPFSVTTDALGNLYESELNSGLFRKITATNAISTYTCGSNVIRLSEPTQGVFDSKGFLYLADFANNVVLRCDPSTGAINSLVSLPNPGGLALDATGSNLYVTEWGAGRVARVSLTSFTATTVAGGGTIAHGASDGMAATNAKLGNPAGIALDSQANVYFTDQSDGVVRRISSKDGTISTVAGNYQTGFAGDGGLATSASLHHPWGLAFDSSGSLYIADVANNRIRKLLINNPPVFTMDNSAVTVSAVSGGAISQPAAVALTSNLSGLLYSTSASQPWLQVSPASGTIPASLQITADPTTLKAGTYTGVITVTALGANPPSQPITVTFTVSSVATAVLAADAQNIGLSVVAGADPVTQQVTIRNQGSGMLGYSASISLDSGAGWLAVSPATGSTSPTTPGVLTVTITPAQLAPGTYSGSISITSAATNQTVVIPIAIGVAAPATILRTSQTGLTFQAVSGGGSPLARTFSVLNGGQGSMTWTAAASTLAGGSWLSVNPASGKIVNPATDASPVTVSVDPTQVPGPGLYYGQVLVNAPGNAVRTVTVQLNVLAAGTATPPDVYPSGLVFSSLAGVNPSSQTVQIANLTAQPITFSSARLVDSGQPWFVAVPSNGVIAPNQPATIVVQPDFTILPPGTSRGTLQLTLADGTVVSVSIVAVAPSATATTSAAGGGRDASCPSNPPPPTVTPVTPASTFPATLLSPVTIEVQLTAPNGCGPITSASVVASFTSNDPNVTLNATNTNATWEGSWVPKDGSQKQVGIKINVATTLPYHLPLASIYYTATLASGAPSPVFSRIANAANGFGTYTAPGGLVSIYGLDLSNAVIENTPCQTQLNQTQVLMGGVPLCLGYVSDGQVNAQIPFGLPVSTTLEIKVQNGATLSVAQDLVVAAAQPAIYTQDETGLGAGSIVDEQTGQQITPQAPTTAGDIIDIYCNGLGEVAQTADANGNFPAVSTVTVNIGGMPAQVNYAGLDPTLPERDVVRAVVPAGVTGPQVQVQLSVAGQTSSAGVTLAIQ